METMECGIYSLDGSYRFNAAKLCRRVKGRATLLVQLNPSIGLSLSGIRHQMNVCPVY